MSDGGLDERLTVYRVVRRNGEAIRLTRPLPIRIHLDEDGIVDIDIEEKGIRKEPFAYGETMDEALEMFAAALYSDVICYSDEPNARLTKDAQDLRDYIRGLVSNWSEIVKERRHRRLRDWLSWHLTRFTNYHAEWAISFVKRKHEGALKLLEDD